MRGAALAVLLASSCRNQPAMNDAGAPTRADPTASATTAPQPPDPRTGGADLVARFECRRCHDDGRGPAPPPNARDDKHCFRCHQAISSGAFEARDAPTTERWRKRVAPLRDVPSLVGSERRLRRAWFARFLLEPHDLRPRLEPTMPRLALTPEDAEAIAAYYTSDDEPPATAPASGDPKRGRTLFDAKGCASCHAFTGAPAAARPAPRPPEQGLTPAVTLAPDLRFARERLRPGALATWLASPKAMKPDTTMPEPGLTPSEASDVAAYVLTAPLTPVPEGRVPARLPVLARPVSYAEVSARVFRKTCWHCHSDPDFAIGDGGPGNTGGFGFPPRGLNLAEYEGIASGELDEHGERRSVFGAAQDGEPRILGVLLSRQREQARLTPLEGALRGMPLGLPALSPDEVQLVESWIAQGRPP